MSEANVGRSRSSWIALLVFGAALCLVVRGLVLAASNSPAIRLVMGMNFYGVALGLLLSLVLVICAMQVEWKSKAKQQRALSSLALLRWSFTATITSAILFIALVQPFQRLWFDLALGLGAGGLALFILSLRWLAGRSPNAAKGLDVIGFGLCAGALGLELGLRGWASYSPSPVTARVGGGPSELVQRFRCKPGEVRYGFPCNSGGHYDEEFERKLPGQTKRIAAIGDSFSVGVVPHAWHYTTIAEGLTEYSIDNLGAPGIGPPEYLSLLVEEALPLNPDAILISLFIGNDLNVEDTLGDLPDAGLRQWLQRDQALLFVIPDRLKRLALERERINQANRQPASAGASSDSMNRAQAAEAFPWVNDPFLEEASLSEEAFQDIELGRAFDLCAQTPASIELVFSSLLAARQAAGKVPIYVMLIPDEFQVEEALWETITKAVKRPMERNQPQRLLNHWLAENKFPTLDLLPILREVKPMEDGRRHLYHLRDTHFNARGNENTGRALAQFLDAQ